MAKKNPENNYNTNLASEFYVLSTLARLGADASLSLGNKKKVDIAIMKSDGKYLTIDVKGVAAQNDWILSNGELDFSENHFYVFISYEKKIADVEISPVVWIFSAKEIKKNGMIKTASNEKTKYVSYVNVRDNYDSDKNKWSKIT